MCYYVLRCLIKHQRIRPLTPGIMVVVQTFLETAYLQSFLVSYAVGYMSFSLPILPSNSLEAIKVLWSTWREMHEFSKMWIIFILVPIYINSHFESALFGRCCKNRHHHILQIYRSFRTSEFIGLYLVCHALFICTGKARINAKCIEISSATRANNRRI